MLEIHTPQNFPVNSRNYFIAGQSWHASPWGSFQRHDRTVAETPQVQEGPDSGKHLSTCLTTCLISVISMELQHLLTTFLNTDALLNWGCNEQEAYLCFQSHVQHFFFNSMSYPSKISGALPPSGKTWVTRQASPIGVSAHMQVFENTDQGMQQWIFKSQEMERSRRRRHGFVFKSSVSQRLGQRNWARNSQKTSAAITRQAVSEAV